MGVTPGVVVDGKLVTNDLVDINLGIRILLGHSFYDDWEDQEMFVTHDPLGNPVDRRHPWNQHTNPQPQKRDFDGNYSWVMCPRWYDGKDHLALDTGGGPLARLWSTALSGLVDTDHLKATGTSVKIHLPKTALKGEVDLEWKIPKWSNTIERDRARSYFQAYAAARRSTSSRRRSPTYAPGTPRPGSRSRYPTRGSAAGSPRRCAACSRTTWSSRAARSPTTTRIHRHHGTPTRVTATARRDPTRTRSSTRPIFEENDLEHFKGIDIMRTVRSFDPCLPCGVHMYLGKGKVLKKLHSPTQVADPELSC